MVILHKYDRVEQWPNMVEKECQYDNLAIKQREKNPPKINKSKQEKKASTRTRKCQG